MGSPTRAVLLQRGSLPGQAERSRHPAAAGRKLLLEHILCLKGHSPRPGHYLRSGLSGLLWLGINGAVPAFSPVFLYACGDRNDKTSLPVIHGRGFFVVNMAWSSGLSIDDPRVLSPSVLHGLVLLPTLHPTVPGCRGAHWALCSGSSRGCPPRGRHPGLSQALLCFS